MREQTEKLAMRAMLVALAFVLAWLEAQIPTFIAVPGVKLGLTNLRLTLNATNLLTITGYDGYDPEIGASTTSSNVFGLDNGRYPSPTSYTFGVSVSF